mmetsp:Transcript_16760/g.14656  ORF Transcript_16760/g.14656 Transcript_16760/m.14656 type:complete len:114 (+) Transcript_16760:474-815(+)
MKKIKIPGVLALFSDYSENCQEIGHEIPFDDSEDRTICVLGQYSFNLYHFGALNPKSGNSSSSSGNGGGGSGSSSSSGEDSRTAVFFIVLICLMAYKLRINGDYVKNLTQMHG